MNSHDFFNEIVNMAYDEGHAVDAESFVKFAMDMVPMEMLNELAEDDEHSEFLEMIWISKFYINDEERLDDGTCVVCERVAHITRHHVYPREVHSKLIKKGYDRNILNTTINVCRMCHSAIHNQFTNDELAASYHTVKQLLADEKFFSYAKWASKQKGRRGVV